MRHEWHECDANDAIATRVKNFDFDNETSENMFPHPYISYMANERLQGSNFILRTSFWKCLVPTPKWVWKVHCKNWILLWQKLYQKVMHYIIAANASWRYRMVTHINTSSFSMKNILCQTNNILLHKNYWKLGKMNARFWENI